MIRVLSRKRYIKFTTDEPEKLAALVDDPKIADIKASHHDAIIVRPPLSKLGGAVAYI